MKRHGSTGCMTNVYRETEKSTYRIEKKFLQIIYPIKV